MLQNGLQFWGYAPRFQISVICSSHPKIHPKTLTSQHTRTCGLHMRVERQIYPSPLVWTARIQLTVCVTYDDDTRSWDPTTYILSGVHLDYHFVPLFWNYITYTFRFVPRVYFISSKGLYSPTWIKTIWKLLEIFITTIYCKYTVPE